MLMLLFISKLPEKPTNWSDEDLMTFSARLREVSKPMILAANKCDSEKSKENIEKMRKTFPNILIYPCSANKLGDSKGNILPDCFLLKNGSTALDFAYYLHTDFGKNFIKAIDAKTKQIKGKEYKLKNRDALEIITR